MRQFAKMTLLAAFVIAIPNAVAETTLAPQLTALSFLIGEWNAAPENSGQGAAKDAWPVSITSQPDGKSIIERDFFDKTGRNKIKFTNTIFLRGNAVQAHITNGDDEVYFTSASIEPRRSVTFAGARSRLSYTLRDPNTLVVTYALAGSPNKDFQKISSTVLRKATNRLVEP